MWISLILIVLVAGIISAMGIGGGAIFIIISTIFGLFSHKEAQGYNLIIFVLVGLSASIKNIKSKDFDQKIFLKLIVPILLGSLVGIYFASIVDEDKIRKYFYVFMLCIGIYEIISSLKVIKKDKLKIDERS
ncbi:MAG: sulfite exporter TauE/SafE family protein [Clostridia bacterium]|nr:sulfite exporter TauE/SafE family protein [Clostridia bacterium]